MDHQPAGDGEIVTLWQPTGQAELDLVKESGWRAWPPRLPDQPIFYPVLNRWYATKITREWNVPSGGAGYVTSFDVRREFLDRYEVQQVGGREVREYWIPAEDLAELNANLVGAIRQEAQFRGPVADAEFTEAADALGHPLPAAWRAYLQGGSWFRCGWLDSGCYLWLAAPREAGEAQEAWQEWQSEDQFPGLALIGGDDIGFLVLDLRQQRSPVFSVVKADSQGWEHARRQAGDLAEFIERVEAGTFDFTFDGR